MEELVQIAAVGELCEDIYIAEDDSILARELGGISLNFARAVASLPDTRAHLIAPVGTDERGRRLLRALDESNVHHHVRRFSGESTSQRIRIRGAGERIFDGFTPGVMSGYTLSEAERELLATMWLVAVPISPDTSSFAADTLAFCHSCGVKTAADFSLESSTGDPLRPDEWIRPFVPHLSVAFVGGRPAHVAPLRALSQKTGLLIVLTLGENGAYAFRGEESWRQLALPTTVVDTTGCGDAFQGAFSMNFAIGLDVATCLEAGAELAARVASKRGAAP